MVLETENMSLGEFLRNEREKRGMTLDQVASSTKVGIRSLHALEADHYAELPAQPFIRGFVTSYCRFIGLDPREVLSRFDGYIRLKVSEFANREGSRSGYAFERKDGERQSRMFLSIAMIGFLATAGAVVLFMKPSLRHRSLAQVDELRATRAQKGAGPMVPVTPVPSLSVGQQLPLQQRGLQSVGEVFAKPVHSTPVSQVPIIISHERQEGSPTASPSVVPEKPSNVDDPLDSGKALSASEVKHKLIFKMQVDTWVRYRVDQRPMRKFLVRQGKVLVLKAQDRVGFQAFPPEGVSFTYNGRPSKLFMEDPNRVTEQGDETLYFPTQPIDKEKQIFMNEKSLPRLIPDVPDSRFREPG